MVAAAAAPPTPPGDDISTRVRRVAIQMKDKTAHICGFMQGEAPREIYLADEAYILYRDKERYVMYVPSTPITNSVH